MRDFPAAIIMVVGSMFGIRDTPESNCDSSSTGTIFDTH